MKQATAPGRPGRPKRALPEPVGPLTERVRHLLEVAHDGNLSDGSALTGLSYPTLRDLYVGRATGPSIRTLERVAAPYGLDAGWLMGRGEMDPIPTIGRLGLLPPGPAAKAKERALREVLIPFRAWPMCDLLGRLERHLNTVPPARERPIVGEATGDAFVFRLTTFVLQPLLAAEKLGGAGIQLVGVGTASRQFSDSELHWIHRLVQVAKMWRTALPQPLLAGGITSRAG